MPDTLKLLRTDYPDCGEQELLSTDNHKEMEEFLISLLDELMPKYDSEISGFNEITFYHPGTDTPFCKIRGTGEMVY